VAGHRRRYDLRDLRSELEAAGFAFAGYTHYQMLLLPLMLLRRWGSGIRSIERNPPSALGRVLGGINAFEVFAFGTMSLPVGSSLIAWARLS
jgi:hypothetical protein